MIEVFSTMRATIFFMAVVLVLQIHYIPALGAQMQTPMSYLQNELASVGVAQQKIMSFLTEKNIRIGQMPLPVSKLPATDDILSRVALSTKDNNIECRISLGKATVGAKCVAPCGCIGSQKWIEFSTYNKLRRKDPSQWVNCQTCQQPFQPELFTPYGGLKGSLVALLLERMSIVRAVGLVGAAMVAYAVDLSGWMKRILTSRVFWQWVSGTVCLLLYGCYNGV